MNRSCSSSKLVTSSLEVSRFSLSLTSSRGCHVVSIESFQVRETALRKVVHQHFAPHELFTSYARASFVLYGEINGNKLILIF